jgi:hypothetical protein
MNFPQYAWFDANATRESAAARLQNEAVGTFLVRRGSQFNQLALSVRRPEGVIHYAMSQSNGEWRWSNGCEPYPSAPGAPTMPALLFGLPDGFINIAKPSQKSVASLDFNFFILFFFLFLD